ncbi:uncharacterized protein LOC121858186 [Homarus americanus]|uniref:uncharacterized protein LOC121858186 n=1 Tax=Homarus americanus TaxID=6706 RepID=UPI001C496E68|nr:uncharacterized protein LOC121858186 [Homarus americanus]
MSDYDDVQRSHLLQEEGIEQVTDNHGKRLPENPTHDKAVKFSYESFRQGMETLVMKNVPGIEEENGNNEEDVRENDDSQIILRRGNDTLEARATIKRLEFKRSRNYRRSLQFIDDTPDSQMDEDSGNFSPQTVGKLVSGSITRSLSEGKQKEKEREESKDEDKDEGELAVPGGGKSRRRYRSRSLSQSSTDSYSTYLSSDWSTPFVRMTAVSSIGLLPCIKVDPLSSFLGGNGRGSALLGLSLGESSKELLSPSTLRPQNSYLLVHLDPQNSYLFQTSELRTLKSTLRPKFLSHTYVMEVSNENERYWFLKIKC